MVLLVLVSIGVAAVCCVESDEHAQHRSAKVTCEWPCTALRPVKSLQIIVLRSGAAVLFLKHRTEVEK